MAGHPQAQGELLEDVFHRLMGRVLERLGLDCLGNRRQGSGLQMGYDLRTSWREPGGSVARWHFELKSNRSPVPLAQVSPKLDQVEAQAHHLDVWCLVCSHSNPVNEVDQQIARENNRDHLPFRLAVLTPDEGGVRDLFACFPDLYEELYEEAVPQLDVGHVDRTLERFRAFLHDATMAGRTKLLPAGWRLIDPAELQRDPPTPAAGRAFLRGLRRGDSWRFVAHDWPVARPRVENGLVERIRQMAPGADGVWLTGAGGEGKTTTVQRVCWRLLDEPAEVAVLWADRYGTDGGVELPVRWIEHSQAACVVVCIDDVPLKRLSAMIPLASRLQDADRRVFLLFCSRAATLARNRSTVRDLSLLTAGDTERQMRPLEADELDAVVARLGEHGLLHRFTPADALALLHRRQREAKRNESWLLPTLLQLTDPRGRGFEQILADVLLTLRGHDHEAALTLLLSIAAVQAAGRGLPSQLAEALCRPSALSTQTDVLRDQLDKQFGEPPPPEELGTGNRFFIYHDVISQGLCDVAAARLPVKWAATLHTLALSVRSSVNPVDVVPPALFHTLEAVRVYLHAERRELGALEQLLRGWVEAADLAFPTWGQLGECYSDQILEAAPHDVKDLAITGAAALQKARSVAEAILGRQDTPRPYRGRRLEPELRYILCSYATLLGRAGTALGNRVLLLRSAVFGLSAFGFDRVTPQQSGSNKVACGTLAVTAIELERYEEAAVLVSAAEQLGSFSLSSLRDRLTDHGQATPKDGLGELLVVFDRLVEEVLQPQWQTIGLYTSGHVQRKALTTARMRLASWLEQTRGLGGGEAVAAGSWQQ